MAGLLLVAAVGTGAGTPAGSLLLQMSGGVRAMAGAEAAAGSGRVTATMAMTAETGTGTGGRVTMTAGGVTGEAGLELCKGQSSCTKQ